MSEEIQDKPKAGLFRRLFGRGETPPEPPPPEPQIPAPASAPPPLAASAPAAVAKESPAEVAERERQSLLRLFGRAPAPEKPAPANLAPPEAAALFPQALAPIEPEPLVFAPPPEEAAPPAPEPPLAPAPESEPPLVFAPPPEEAPPSEPEPAIAPTPTPEAEPPLVFAPAPNAFAPVEPPPAAESDAASARSSEPPAKSNPPVESGAPAARGVLGRLFGREAAPDLARSDPASIEPETAPAPGVLGRLFNWDAPVGEPEAEQAPPPPGVDEAGVAAAGRGVLGRLLGGGEAETAEPETPKRSWLSRLTFGLSRSSSAIGRGIVDIFTKRKLDETSLDDLEDILLQADLGLGPATRIREAIGKGRYEKGIDPDEVKRLLAEEVERTLAPVARPLVIDATRKPFVILVVGVNGSGKTTTIGKLAAKFANEGRKVMLAAGDTFRAAAIEQLKIWAGRARAEIFAREQGGDAAGLAFDALTRARAEGADVLLMDTAGRLQNRAELMKELEKIVRVMKKVDPTAPHATLLVLDATVGQNALSQVEIFGRIAGVTGLVMTKLDGTARGGILVAIADKHKLPVHFIGVGEQMEDLEPFAARDFAHAIAGRE